VHATLRRSTPREHSLEDGSCRFSSASAPSVPNRPAVDGVPDRKTASALGDALAVALRRRRALLIASTDLSHYTTPGPPARSSRVVSTAWGGLDPDGLQTALEARPEHACGGGPTVAVMRAARASGARDAVILNYAGFR